MDRKEEVEIIIKNLVDQIEDYLKKGSLLSLKRDFIIEKGKLLEKYKAELQELHEY